MKTTRGLYTTSFLAGIAGGVVFLAGMLLCQGLGISTYSLPLMLGSRVTGTTGFDAWLVGTLIHLLGAGVTAFVYGTMFRLTALAGWRVGFLIGFAHWLVAGLILGMFTDALGLPEAPGFYGTVYGAATFVELIVLYVLYGAVVGGVFEAAVDHHRTAGLTDENFSSNSPLADSLGQADVHFDEYRKHRQPENNRHVS